MLALNLRQIMIPLCIFTVKYFSYFCATASKPKAFSIPGHGADVDKVAYSSFDVCGIEENRLHSYTKEPPR